MAEKNWTVSANRAADIVDDDPFAALARLGELDAGARQAASQPATSVDEMAELDLEAELLQEFERYDAAGSSTEPATADVPATEEPLPAVDEEELEIDFGLEAAIADELSAIDVDAVEPAEEPVDEDIEPAFAGPVPDLDFQEPAEAEMPQEPIEAAAVFAGPVPDMDDLGADDLEADFSGPTPDLDFAADFSAAPSGASIFDDIPEEEPEASAEDLMTGELEKSLGLVEVEPPAASEPASAFSEWKNERLTINSSRQDDGWAPEPVLGHPGEELSDAEVPVVDGPSEEMAAAEPETPNAAIEEETSISQDVEEAQEPQFIDPLEELQAIMASTPSPERAPAHLPAAEPEFAASAQQAVPSAEAAFAKKPEADAEFDIDFDTLEMDLASVELDELEEIQSASSAGVSAPKADVEPEPEPELAFDPTQISDVDHDAEFIADLQIPLLPEEEGGAAAPSKSADYDFEFEADMVELFAGDAKQEDKSVKDEDLTEDDEALNDAFAYELKSEIDENDTSDDVVAGFHGYDDAQPVLPPMARNRRGGRLMAGAAVVAALLIVGGAYAWLNSGAGSDVVFAGGGEPPVIMAETSGFKEEPESPGGAVVPNQDKAVYDRVEGNSENSVTQQNLISSEEEPVDVAQSTGQENLLPLEIGEESATQESGTPQDDRLLPGGESDTAGVESEAPAVAPRKVKTMIVMPDGTLVARETPDPAPQTIGSSTTENAASTSDNASAAGGENATGDGNSVDNAVAAAANAEVANSDVQPVNLTPAPGTPIPTSRPTDQPVNVVSTVTDRGTVTENQTAAPVETASAQTEQPAAQPVQQTNVAPGTYMVQIASLTSQESAQNTYQNLASRFSSIIGGKGVDIKRADIEGRGTYYRVRIPAGTRAEAIALCERYKAAGGSCLVSQ